MLVLWDEMCRHCGARMLARKVFSVIPDDQWDEYYYEQYLISTKMKDEIKY